MASKTKFNKRAFITYGMLTAGVTLPVSGLINHLTGFEPLTTARHFWMTVHNVSGILFVIFGVNHTILNRHAVKNYLMQMKSRFITKEALSAMSVVAFMTVLFALHALIAA